MIERREEMTPREWAQINHEKEMFEKQAEQVLAVKRLELEVTKLEAKWSSWLKIPVTIIKLPVLVLFGIAYICSMFTKRDMPDDFWRLMK